MKGVAALALALCMAGAGAAQEGADEAQATGRHHDMSDRWLRTYENVLSGFKNMYHPCVRQVDDDEYPFYMWFFGWADEDCNPGYEGCDAIYFARGKTLDAWEVYRGDDGWDVGGTDPSTWVPVLTAREKVFYDSWHNGDPSVVLKDGTYYMAYSATGPDKDGILFGMPNDTDGDILCVMGAVSDDGIHWTRSEEPLLLYEPEIGEPGNTIGDAYLHGMYHRPSLLFEDGRWRLWFDYWGGPDKGVSMGYAEAAEGDFMKGGFEVLRAGDDPLLPEWPNPDVIEVDGRYRSYADPSGYGEGWPGRQVAEAVSADGIEWTVTGYLPPDPDTPANQIPVATVVDLGAGPQLVVFYACQNGGDPYDYRYSRIRYAVEREEPAAAGAADDGEGAGE
jgi:hypothetical protein